MFFKVHMQTCITHTHRIFFSLKDESLLSEGSISSPEQGRGKSESKQPEIDEGLLTHRHTHYSYYTLKHNFSLAFCHIVLLLLKSPIKKK